MPRRLQLRAALLVLGVLALLGGLAYVLLDTPVTALRSVSVTGTARTDPDAVRAAAADQLGRPLLRVDEDAVRRGTAHLPFVRSVQVHRRWLHGVEVEVTERVAVAAVATSGGRPGYDVLDAAGKVITTTPALLDGVPLVDVDVRAAGPRALGAAGQVARVLPADLRTEVARVSATSPEDVRLELRRGQVVRWGSAESSGLKAEVLITLLQTDARAYDVSAPTEPATSPRAGPATTSRTAPPAEPSSSPSPTSRASSPASRTASPASRAPSPASRTASPTRSPSSGAPASPTPSR